MKRIKKIDVNELTEYETVRILRKRRLRGEEYRYAREYLNLIDGEAVYLADGDRVSNCQFNPIAEFILEWIKCDQVAFVGDLVACVAHPKYYIIKGSRDKATLLLPGTIEVCFIGSRPKTVPITGDEAYTPYCMCNELDMGTKIKIHSKMYSSLESLVHHSSGRMVMDRELNIYVNTKEVPDLSIAPSVLPSLDNTEDRWKNLLTGSYLMTTEALFTFGVGDYSSMEWEYDTPMIETYSQSYNDVLLTDLCKALEVVTPVSGLIEMIIEYLQYGLYERFIQGPSKLKLRREKRRIMINPLVRDDQELLPID